MMDFNGLSFLNPRFFKLIFIQYNLSSLPTAAQLKNKADNPAIGAEHLMLEFNGLLILNPRFVKFCLFSAICWEGRFGDYSFWKS